MSAALAYHPHMGLAGPRLTAKQAKLAELVATKAVSTVTEAAALAGMNRSHAARSLHHNATVQGELKRLQSVRRDTAKSIRHAALGKAGRALDRLEIETLDQAVSAMQVAGMAAQIEEKLPEEQADPAVQDAATRAASCRRMLSAYRAGYRAAIRGQAPRAALPVFDELGIERPTAAPQPTDTAPATTDDLDLVP